MTVSFTPSHNRPHSDPRIARRPARGSRNDRYDREPARDACVLPPTTSSATNTKHAYSSGSVSVRVENIHYDIQEPDLRVCCCYAHASVGAFADPEL